MAWGSCLWAGAELKVNIREAPESCLDSLQAEPWVEIGGQTWQRFQAHGREPAFRAREEARGGAGRT